MTEGTWLYAVTGEKPAPEPTSGPVTGAGSPSFDVDVQQVTRGPAGPCLLSGLCGVAGEPVRSVACDGLAAVVGTVDLDQFGEEPLRRALADSDFVAQIARIHHEVIATVADARLAVPFRLATIFIGDERVQTFVGSHRGVLDAILDRVAGRAEWGVKAYLTQTGTPPPAIDTGATSGRAYLMRRREQLGRREAAWARAAACGDEIHTALSGIVAAAVRHPVQADEQDGGEPMVLKAAYLVDTAEVDAFTRRLGGLSQGASVRLEVTGPWPAYSFAEVGDPR